MLRSLSPEFRNFPPSPELALDELPQREFDSVVEIARCSVVIFEINDDRVLFFKFQTSVKAFLQQLICTASHLIKLRYSAVIRDNLSILFIFTSVWQSK